MISCLPKLLHFGNSVTLPRKTDSWLQRHVDGQLNNSDLWVRNSLFPDIAWPEELFTIPDEMHDQLAGKEKMKIAVVAPPWMALPTEKYGGIEAIIIQEVRYLLERGHEVFLYAPKGTKLEKFLPESLIPKCHLKEIMDKSLRLNQKQLSRDVSGESILSGHAELFQEVFEDALDEKFDIVHNHVGYIGMHYDAMLEKVRKKHKDEALPVWITTKHNPDSQSEVQRILAHAPHSRLAAVAEHQLEAYPEQRFCDTVHNGVDFSQFTPRFETRKDGPIKVGFFARLSSPSKGPEDAIKAVLKANAMRGGTNANPKIVLIMAGKVNEEEIGYYKKVIEPYFKEYPGIIKRHEAGELNHQQRAEFLSDMDAILHLGHGEEPFGLTMVEAMASGTPVITYNYASTPNIISQGINGIRCTNLFEAAVSIINCREWFDRRLVYESALKRFPVSRMNAGYEALFYKLLKNPNFDREAKKRRFNPFRLPH